MLTCRFPKSGFRFAVFLAYNMLYVTYMMGLTSQLLYLATMVLFCLMNFVIMFRNKERALRGLRECKYGFSYITTFLIISLFIQFLNGDFQGYLIEGLLRLALPIINAFFFVNATDDSDYKWYFDALLLRFVVHFMWQMSGSLSIESVLGMSWIESDSATETSMAHDFLIVEMYYLMTKQKKKAAIALVFCMLSMKRLSFILAPFIFLLANRVPDNKEVNGWLVNGLKVIAILSPFVIMYLYDYSTMSWISSNLNIDLNELMSGRPAIYHTLLLCADQINGYGSVNAILSSFVFEQYGTTWNGILHNDFLRIYLETSIVGVVVLAHSLTELGRRNYWHFFMVAYLIIVAITSHILNYFSVWVTLYMVIMCTNQWRSSSRASKEKE